MGKIYQCIGRVAGTPYTVKNTHINLYCIEELCYYIVHNAELMDQTLASEELISWVNEECGLKDLAVKIKERLHHSIRPEAVAETVLNYCHYCSADELERTLKVIKGVCSESGPERTKSLAEYFLAGKRYAHAFSGFERLYKYAGINGDEKLKGECAYSLGVIYAELFFYEDAAERFKEAFEISGDRQACFSYLAALRMSMDEMEYFKYVASLPSEYTEAAAVEEAFRDAKPEKIPEASGYEGYAAAVKEEYREMMAG